MDFYSSESAEALGTHSEKDPTESLSRADADEYRRLRDSFSASSPHDRHQATFQQEIKNIVQFVERSKEGREERALAAGLVYTGTYFCVNTQQLKKLIGRCKSSINSGFQQMGFLSVKMKTRARSCLFSALPSLANDASGARQWTVRSYPPAVFGMKQGMVPLSPVPVIVPAVMPSVPQVVVVPERQKPVQVPMPIISLSHLNHPASAPLKRSELTESIQKPAYHAEFASDDEFCKSELFEFGADGDNDGSLCLY